MSQESITTKVTKELKRGTNDLSITNVSVVVSKAVEVVDTEAVSGPEKKEIVINSLNRLIRDSKMTRDNKQRLNMVVDTVVPQMIDVVVKASKGELNVNKQVEKIARGCLGFF